MIRAPANNLELATMNKLKEMDTLPGEATLSQQVLKRSTHKKGSTLKGKNLLPGGANSFLLE